MPILHRLQEAFLAFEEQAGSDWKRGWYDFATEWPDAIIDATADLHLAGITLYYPATSRPLVS